MLSVCFCGWLWFVYMSVYRVYECFINCAFVFCWVNILYVLDVYVCAGWCDCVRMSSVCVFGVCVCVGYINGYLIGVWVYEFLYFLVVEVAFVCVSWVFVCMFDLYMSVSDWCVGVFVGYMCECLFIVFFCVQVCICWVYECVVCLVGMFIVCVFVVYLVCERMGEVCLCMSLFGGCLSLLDAWVCVCCLLCATRL